MVKTSSALIGFFLFVAVSQLVACASADDSLPAPATEPALGSSASPLLTACGSLPDCEQHLLLNGLPAWSSSWGSFTYHNGECELFAWSSSSPYFDRPPECDNNAPPGATAYSPYGYKCGYRWTQCGEDDGCVPSCDGLECGDDGCGGTCGTCESGAVCSAEGLCECVPSCEGLACGDDGCGGTCGACESGEICVSGLCQTNGGVGPCGSLTDCELHLAQNGLPAWESGYGLFSFSGGECDLFAWSSSSPYFDTPPECDNNVPPGATAYSPYGYKCGYRWTTCGAVGSCTPNCEGRACGNDGCGGSCGSCESGESCSAEGLCECVPSCDGLECGDDGCGGSCGSCESGEACTTQGACVVPCEPSTEVCDGQDNDCDTVIDEGCGTANAPTVTVARYQGGMESAYSMTFDDNLWSQYDTVFPLLESYDFDATFFLVAERICEIGERWCYSPDWSVWQEVAAAGHEIGNHSMSHWMDDPDYTLEEMIVGAADLLAANIPTPIISFAYPGGGRSGTEERIAYMDSLVASRHIGWRRGNDAEGTIVNRKFVNFGTGCETDMNGTLDQVLAHELGGWPAHQPTTWLIGLWHGVDEGYCPITESALANHFDYVTTRRDELWIAPFGDVLRYEIERDATTVSVHDAAPNSVTFSGGNALDQRFDVPLTYVIDLEGRTVTDVSVQWEASGVAVPAVLRDGKVLITVPPSSDRLLVVWTSS